jgi:hypothetical protein
VPGIAYTPQLVRYLPADELRHEKSGGDRDGKPQAAYLVARVTVGVMVAVMMIVTVIVGVTVRGGRLLWERGRQGRPGRRGGQGEPRGATARTSSTSTTSTASTTSGSFVP